MRLNYLIRTRSNKKLGYSFGLRFHELAQFEDQNSKIKNIWFLFSSCLLTVRSGSNNWHAESLSRNNLFCTGVFRSTGNRAPPLRENVMTLPWISPLSVTRTLSRFQMTISCVRYMRNSKSHSWMLVRALTVHNPTFSQPDTGNKEQLLELNRQGHYLGFVSSARNDRFAIDRPRTFKRTLIFVLWERNRNPSQTDFREFRIL